MKKIILIIAIVFSGRVMGQVKPDTATRPAPVSSGNVHAIPSAYSSGIKVNYVRVWEATKPFAVADSLTSSFRTVEEVKQTTQYFDGLGRPIQTVAKKISPSGKDMVSPIVYDEFGREQFKYLPYVQTDSLTNTGKFKPDPFHNQASFYSNTTYNPGLLGEQVYYSQTRFENSPLARSDTVFAPGNSWGGSHVGVSMKYLINKVSDSVRIWNISMTIGSSPTTSAKYAAGQLIKTVTVDENGKQVVEYKNKEGQVLLKKVQLASSPSTHHTGWLCTYYVYDDFGNLRFVIPPKAVESISSNWTIGSTVRDELCFRYEYDARRRMIIKKVPGAGEVNMVYDAKDRLIMTQDANMINEDNRPWIVTVYDDLNRPTETYLWYADELRADIVEYIESDPSWPLSYNNHGDPTLLTQTYYDDYSWVSGSGSGLSSTLITTYNSNTDYFYTASNSTSPYPQAITASYETKGMETGTKVNVLGTSTYSYTTSFYDDRGRVVQSHSTNYSGSKDTTTMQYDFSGKELRSLLCHAKGGTNSQRHIILTKTEYDVAGRVTIMKKKTNNSPEVSIAENSYDELGQLKKKYLGRKRDESSQNTYTSDAIDSLTYSYNIRGWLSGINKDYARTGGATNWFGMELDYDFGFTSTQKNGDIAGMRWRSNGSDSARAYGFAYDAVNRLLKADFTQYAGAGSGAWNNNAGIDLSMKMGDGSDPTTAYDANGNILKMWQMGLKINTSATIDSLNYAYLTSSNKLAKVTDGITADNKLGDFKDGTNGSSDDYDYDVNGNMKLDLNKKITEIIYNHLNLPDSIRILGKGIIKYTYDAIGIKLSKKTVDSTGSPVKTTITKYLGGFVYQQDTLQYAATEEGRTREKRVNGQDTMYYDYFIKDHLGNVRMVLTDELKTDIYQATMETANATYEEALFNNIAGSRSAKPSGDIECPFDSDSGNDYIAYVHGGTESTIVGPSKLIKVMAGDKFKLSVYGMKNCGEFVLDPFPPDVPVLSDIVTQLLSSAVASQGKLGLSSSALESYISPAVNAFLSRQDNLYDMGNAYLNWILLDEEQLKLVNASDNSGFVELGAGAKQLLQSNEGDEIEVTKNGYLYVYVSNSYFYDGVFFDDLRIEHTRGPLLEETHYYPFGLEMAGIGSKAASFGEPDNKKKYNGIDWENDLDIAVYDAYFRELDPQTGRWWQIDPEIESMEAWSPYASNYDNPVTFFDPLGNEPDDGGIWQGIKNAVVSFGKAVMTPPVVTLFTVGKSAVNGDIKPAATLLAPSIGKADDAVTFINGNAETRANIITSNILEVGAAFAGDKIVGSKSIAAKTTEVKVKPADYSGLKDNKSVGAGKPFTPAQKKAILETNKQQNGGKIKSDLSGKVADKPVQAKKGVKANMNQAEVDHKNPKSKGGTNSYSNAQVLIKKENLHKGAN